MVFLVSSSHISLFLYDLVHVALFISLVSLLWIRSLAFPWVWSTSWSSLISIAMFLASSLVGTLWWAGLDISKICVFLLLLAICCVCKLYLGSSYILIDELGLIDDSELLVLVLNDTIIMNSDNLGRPHLNITITFARSFYKFTSRKWRFFVTIFKRIVMNALVFNLPLTSLRQNN